MLAEELREAAFVHVCSGKTKFSVFGFTVKRAVPQAGDHPDNMPVTPAGGWHPSAPQRSSATWQNAIQVLG